MKYIVVQANSAQTIQDEINKHAQGAVKLFSLTVVPGPPGQGLVFVAVLENATMVRAATR
jgi:hypothetical protein